MPTEPLSAIVYIFLLVPGIVFVYKTEMHTPTVRRSAFRETATVIVVSAFCLFTVVFIGFIFSFVNDGVRDWFEQFIAEPEILLSTNTQLFVAIVLSGILLVAGMGYGLGTKRVQQVLERVIGESNAINRTRSAWTDAFELYEDAEVVVGIQLKSGTWVQGQIFSYNPMAHDDPDRALILTGEIKYRTQKMRNAESFEGMTMLVVQASEIDFFAVGHNEPEV